MSSRPALLQVCLPLGALSGAITCVNIVLGSTVVAAPSPTGPTPGTDVAVIALWSEFAASAALAGLSGFLIAHRGRAVAASAGAGALTGAMGALVAVVINVLVFAFGSMAALNVYSAQLGEAGPGAVGGGFIPYLLWIVTIWGLGALIASTFAGFLAGLIGGAIGRLSRPRAPGNAPTASMS
jgi:hypothetical protein